MHDYTAFLQSRRAAAPAEGFTVDPRELHPSLFPFQRECVTRSLARGRAALFCDTGMGKSRMILEWMRCVTAHTSRRCLLLTPLAVAQNLDVIGVQEAESKVALAGLSNATKADMIAAARHIFGRELSEHESDAAAHALAGEANWRRARLVREARGR